jgi:hypothetical protein
MTDKKPPLISNGFFPPLAFIPACLIVFSTFVYGLMNFISIVDDAYISFRYLDNWLAGLGLVFNPGERIEGYTNFLWIVVLAPLRLSGLEVETASLALSVVSLVLLGWAVYHTAKDLAGNRQAGWAALILMLGSHHLARWAGSGMETVFFAALIALANQQLVARDAHAPASSLLYGLAALTRPTGVLHAAIAFVVVLPWNGSQRIGRAIKLFPPALLFLLFPVGHFLFRWFYYGSPLPNTAYTKLGGNPADVIPLGLQYVGKFLISGGGVLFACFILSCFFIHKRTQVAWVLFGQVLLQILYVVWVGGDFFLFGRFMIPVIPTMAILGGVGLFEVSKKIPAHQSRALAASALCLALIQTGGMYYRNQYNDFENKKRGRADREQVANWVSRVVPENGTIAINVAGVIPYRTGLRTIDMLGLTDYHIARVDPDTKDADGVVFVGHFKHDGEYVCDRLPDLVLTGAAELIRGQNLLEAANQPGISPFPGDREFLRAKACQGRYRPVGEEIRLGKFAVAYQKISDQEMISQTDREPTNGKEWFERGLSLMSRADHSGAIQAFEESLRLNPGHPTVMTDLAYCHLRENDRLKALEIFEQVLRADPRQFDALFGLATVQTELGNREQAIKAWQRYILEAPASTWKTRAKYQLQVLRQ